MSSAGIEPATLCLKGDSSDETTYATNPHYPYGARVCGHSVETARRTNPLYSEAEPSQNLPTLPLSDPLPYGRPRQRGGGTRALDPSGARPRVPRRVPLPASPGTEPRVRS